MKIHLMRLRYSRQTVSSNLSVAIVQVVTSRNLMNLIWPIKTVRAGSASQNGARIKFIKSCRMLRISIQYFRGVVDSKSYFYQWFTGIKIYFFMCVRWRLTSSLRLKSALKWNYNKLDKHIRTSMSSVDRGLSSASINPQISFDRST